MAFPAGFDRGQRMDEAFTGHAAGAILANRFVVRGSGGYTNPAAAGGRVDGIAEYAVASGAEFTVFRGGEHLCETGAAVADGDDLSSDNVGRCVTATTGSGATIVVAKAFGAAAGAGSFIIVQLAEI